MILLKKAYSTLEMNDRLETLKQVGPQALDVFQRAGYYHVHELQSFDTDDERKLSETIQNMRREDEGVRRCDHAYWRRLGSRCRSIVYRVQSAQADRYIPNHLMCPLTLDWFEDPVITKYGHSYERSALEEYLARDARDPLAREPLTKSDFFPNQALKDISVYYRLHHRQFLRHRK